MFNKSILGPFPTIHLDLWAMTWRCKCLRTCTCITPPDCYSYDFSGRHPLSIVILSFIFVFLTHSYLFHPPHLMQTSIPLSTKQFLFLACIWHINAPGLALTSHVVKFIHWNSHIALLTSVQEPPWLACLCRTYSRSSTAIYPMHVLVCLRAFCSIHTMWMTFGPLFTVPTWGTARATTVDWPHWSFI